MKIKTRFLYIPILLLFIAGCSDTGIFYSLENEEKILDANNLNDNANFSNMVDTGNYYIGNAGPTIYYRSKASNFSKWSKLPMPSGFGPDATSPSMVRVGPDLFISRRSEDSTNLSGVFRLDDINTTITSASASSWTTIHSEASSSIVFKLHSANATLYIHEFTKGDTPASTLIYSSSPGIDLIGAYSADISANLGISDTDILVEIAYDGANYWALVNNPSSGEIYRDVTNADFSTRFTQNSGTSGKFVDFYFIDSTQVMFSNNEGKIYNTLLAGDASANPGSQDAITWASTGSIDGVYNGFSDISSLGGTAADTILVGTMAKGSISGDGYHQLSISTGQVSSSSNFSDLNNYNSSELSDATINGFLFDSVNERIFAYTGNNEGVWMNIDDGGRTWSHE